MKLWVDDLREPPDWKEPDGKWRWAKTSHEAICCLKHWTHIEEMSLDHDLGGDDTTRPIVLAMCKKLVPWPDTVVCHSANPVGRDWIEGMVTRYAPSGGRKKARQ